MSRKAQKKLRLWRWGLCLCDDDTRRASPSGEVDDFGEPMKSTDVRIDATSRGRPA